MLAEFGSVVDAVRCAVDIQRGMAERNAEVPQEKRIEFRIGINMGDVIFDRGDIFGDGVNVAARLEGVAEPGGICVSGRVQEDARGKLDVSFEDAGEQQLKNIAQPVRAYRVRVDGGPRVSARPALALPDKPSIAVLSFTNMTGDPNQEYFGDGIAEDIITTLSHSPSLFVIARNSCFTYKGRAVDVKQIARELGVRYVLEGSVRRGGNRIRITAQLINAETGNHLWAERYDRDLADIFAVQDEITKAVAIAIEPAVVQMERQLAVRKPPGNLGAWEAYQRGLWHMGRIGETESEATKHFLRRAIDLDPHFAAAHADLAMAILQDLALYSRENLAEALDEFNRLAQRAISLDPRDATGHISMGWGLFWRGDHQGMLAQAHQALALSNYADAHHLLGAALLYSGRPREGLEPIREAIRLDPHSPAMSIWLFHIALAHYGLSEYETCIEVAKQTLCSYPDHPFLLPLIAQALGQVGRLDEAKQCLQRAIAVVPQFFDMYVHQRHPCARPEDYEHMLEGLRKAGWEG
jgi:adenylate cyclase